MEYGWCTECGRRFHQHDEKSKRCSIGNEGRKKRVELQHGVAYSCGEEWNLSNEPVCPHDGNPLRTSYLNPSDLSPGAPRVHRFICGNGSRFNDEVALVQAQLYELPGVHLRAKLRRQYPGGKELGHILGYMNEVSAKDLKERGKAYKAGDFIGRSGVERSFEELLRGKFGRRVIARNASGAENTKGSERASVGTKSQPVEDGNDLYLSIDAELQRVAASALRWQKSGAIVVMELTVERYWPCIPSRSSTRMYGAGDLPLHPKRIRRQSLRTDDQQGDNRLRSGFDLQIITALAGLEEGVIHPSWSVECPGYYMFGGRKIPLP